MRIVALPWRAKYVSVRSMSLFRTPTNLPYFTSSGLPPALPIQ